jgi:hypothetical protein
MRKCLDCRLLQITAQEHLRRLPHHISSLELRDYPRQCLVSAAEHREAQTSKHYTPDSMLEPISFLPPAQPEIRPACDYGARNDRSNRVPLALETQDEQCEGC